MRRSAPLIIAAVALVGLGVSLFELHQARDRYWKLALFQSHDHMHREVREFMIRSALIGLDRPVIVIGDSITEMARFPETLEGRQIVNAGIGGATISDFEKIAPVILQNTTPSVIVISLGSNDGGAALRDDYAALLSQLKKFAPRLVAVAVPPQRDSEAKNIQLRDAAKGAGVPFIEPTMQDSRTLEDGIHLSAEASRQWVSALVASICEGWRK